MKQLSVIFLLLTFVGRIVYAQADFRQGQIFTLAHDTVTGFIDYRGDINNSERCTFKSGLEEPAKEFLPGKIEGYRFTGGKYYVSKVVRREDGTVPAFVEYLVEGKKNLYSNKDSRGLHFLIDYVNDTVVEIPWSQGYQYLDGKEYLRESTVHQGYLKAYFSDCPELYTDISRINKPDFSNMVSLTKKYHHLVCGDSGCIIYYKRPPGFRMAAEPTIGMIRLNHGGDYQIQYGLLLHFWMPRQSERLYLVTGVIYSMPDFYGDRYTMIKIPLLFEYQFPFRVVKPRFDVGVNYINFSNKDNPTAQGISFSGYGGVYIRLAEFLYLDFSAGIDLTPYFTWESLYLSHTFYSGIYIKF
jgi:hypothetical protein